MKKFSLIIVLTLMTFLITSCGIDQIFSKDLNQNDLNKEKNIVEKPKEEVRVDKEPKGETVEETEKQEETEEIKESVKQPEIKEDEKIEKDKNTIKNEDKHNETVFASSNISDLRKIEKKGYVTVNGLNVRNLGSMKGKVISVINKGVEVYVFGEKENWYYVEYAKNKRAWVYSRYIQFTPIKVDLPKTPTKKPTNISDLRKVEKKGYVTVNGLNVRNLGSMKGKVITVINKGVEVHVFGEKNSWYYIEYAKNKRGWVYSKYIQFTPIKSRQIDINSLSNKSYNWYFIRNNKHQQPGFDNSYKALLDKYDGIDIGNKNKKDIFLTFDNGYENGYTEKILDILKKQNVKVGFFVQGTYIDAEPDIVKRMVKEGHIVLNHTNNHPQMPTLSIEKLEREIKIVAEKYEKLTGEEMLKFLRPPSGVFSERTLAQAKNLGYRSVFWSMAYRDWVVDDQPGKSESYKHVIDNIHNGAVILLHSVSKSNTDALEDIIIELKRQGYSFKLLTEYP